jgi:cyclic pyranopterin phosphate synthase
MSPRTAALVERGEGPKGEVLGVARLAGIQAAKQTATLIPLAHPIALSFVAAVTVYDMVKGVERGVTIERIGLLEKTGGRSDWRPAPDT